MTVAMRYAKAALGVAQADKTADKADFPALADAISVLAQVVTTPSMAEALRNPKMTGAQQSQLAETMAKAVKAPKALANLLRVLATNGRLALLPAVLQAMQTLMAKQAGIVEAVVQSAQPLTDSQKISLKVQIKTHQKAKDVRLTEVVKPEILGGFRAFFGGLVWDTSVLGGLNRLKAVLKQQNL